MGECKLTIKFNLITIQKIANGNSDVIHLPEKY